jgi:hypothetical protein
VVAWERLAWGPSLLWFGVYIRSLRPRFFCKSSGQLRLFARLEGAWSSSLSSRPYANATGLLGRSLPRPGVGVSPAPIPDRLERVCLVASLGRSGYAPELRVIAASLAPLRSPDVGMRRRTTSPPLLLDVQSNTMPRSNGPTNRHTCRRVSTYISPVICGAVSSPAHAAEHSPVSPFASPSGHTPLGSVSRAQRWRAQSP